MGLAIQKGNETVDLSKTSWIGPTNFMKRNGFSSKPRLLSANKKNNSIIPSVATNKLYPEYPQKLRWFLGLAIQKGKETVNLTKKVG